MPSSEEVSSVRVFARFRPTRAAHAALACEVDAELAQIRMTKSVHPRGKRFRFDGVLGSDSTQREAFDAIARAAVAECLRGFNATILAYGQTGSGKTHTMLGAGFGEGTAAATTEKAWDPNGSVAGLMPRVVQSLFRGLVDDDKNSREGALIELSMLEIYNENIRDLLGDRGAGAADHLVNHTGAKFSRNRSRGGAAATNHHPSLRLRETPDRGVWVEGLARQPCATDSDVLALIEAGSAARSTAQTKMNAMSSRSHVVVTVNVTQKKIDGTTVKAKLHLVDLAGSERVGKTEAQGLTLREAQSINQSLSALGNCMRALTTASTKHVPFRDSKLTHLLRDSLGGNAKTTMVICLASDAKNEDETLSTLRFGSRAKRIQCVAKLNRVGGALSDLKRSVALLTARVELLSKENAVLKQQSAQQHQQQQQQLQPSQEEGVGGGGGESKQSGNNIVDASSSSAAECEALKLQLSSVQHKLSEATASVDALSSSKSEIQKYADTLLEQLNDAEEKSSNQASLMTTKDEQLLAAREAVAQERERLRDWESELSAQREASYEKVLALETSAAKRERMLEERERELHEREQDVEVKQATIMVSRKEAVASTAAAQAASLESTEASLARLREKLEERNAQRAAELEERAQAAEARVAERERGLAEGQARLHQQLEKLDERQAQAGARELEVAAKAAGVEEKAKAVAESMKRMEDAEGNANAALRETLDASNLRFEDLQRKMHRVEVDGAKRKHRIEQMEVECAAKSRDVEQMKQRVSRSEARIADLENQLLSVYYGHKAQKEQDAQDREYIRRHKEEAAEQERRDAALAKRIAERGSDMSAYVAEEAEEAEEAATEEEKEERERRGAEAKAMAESEVEVAELAQNKLASLAMESMTQEQKDLIEKIRAEKKRVKMVGESKNEDFNPFTKMLSEQAAVARPSPGGNVSTSRQTRAELPLLSPPAPSATSLSVPRNTPSSSYILSDHELALKLFQEEKDAFETRRGGGLTAVTPPLPAIIGSSSQRPSPFESLREGKEFILDSDAGLHQCRQNVGFGRWNDRFILLHAPTFEVVILKPNAAAAAVAAAATTTARDSQRFGRAVVLKRRRRIQNLSLESGGAKRVTIRSAKDNKNFTFDFVTVEMAGKFRAAFTQLWRQSAVVK